MNVVSGRLTADGETPVVSVLGTTVPLHSRRVIGNASRGDVFVGIRPEDLLWRRGLAEHHVRATVELVEPMGHEAYVTARSGDAELVARFPPRSGVAVHETVDLGLDPERLHVFDAESGDALLAPHEVHPTEIDNLATAVDVPASPAQ